MAYNLDQIFLDVEIRLASHPRIAPCKLALESGYERHIIERAVRAATGVTFREHQKRILLSAAVTLLTDGPFSRAGGIESFAGCPVGAYPRILAFPSRPYARRNRDRGGCGLFIS